MTELLRPDDAFFLYTESDRVHQHVGGLAVLDPSTRQDGPVHLRELQGRVRDQLAALPRFRQRLAVPRFSLARPVWVDAEDFDLDRHVKLCLVAAPGGRRQLEAAVEAIMSEPLDRRYPLWEVHLLSGVAGGRQAILIKLHHAIADGLGTLAVAARILDPSTGSASGADWHPRPAPGRTRLALTALCGQIRESWTAFTVQVRRLRASPRRTVRRAARTAHGVWQLARAGTAKPTSINRSAGPARRIVLTEVPLDAVVAAQRRHAGTANDVVLTAVAEALAPRLARSDPGLATVRTMVPVAGRRGSAASSPGSWTSTLSIDLPIGPMTPGARHRQVVLTTRRAKHSDQPAGSRLVMNVVGRWAPAFLHRRFARWAYRGKWFNIIVSNLRGARSRRSLVGADVEVAYPIVPLAKDVGLALASMTWEDTLTVGLTADPEVVPDVNEIAVALVEAILDLAGVEEAELEIAE